MYLFAFLDTLLVGLAWQWYLHPKFAFKNKYYLEMIAYVGYVWRVYVDGFWIYLFVAWLSTSYLFVNFSLNHTFLPITTEPTHWVEYSLRHTADVEHTSWCAWWMGYLNYQIEHHLFPAMPQFRNRLIRDRVKALAEKHNIPYVVHSYPQAIRNTFKNLANVSKNLKDS